MISRFRARERVVVGDRVLAAIVSFGGGCALAFQATIRSLSTRYTRGEAVKRPDQQNHGHQADRDVSSPPHPALE
jgi:hypothetical protein